jgi:hypothetical protein
MTDLPVHVEKMSRWRARSCERAACEGQDPHEDSRLHRIQRSVRPDDVGRDRLFSMMMRLAGPNATTPTASFAPAELSIPLI